MKRNGRERVVRPHRYATALVFGLPLSPHDIAEHEACDNPICLRVETCTTGHVWRSTQSDTCAGWPNAAAAAALDGTGGGYPPTGP